MIILGLRGWEPMSGPLLLHTLICFYLMSKTARLASACPHKHISNIFRRIVDTTILYLTSVNKEQLFESPSLISYKNIERWLILCVHYFSLSYWNCVSMNILKKSCIIGSYNIFHGIRWLTLFSYNAMP